MFFNMINSNSVNKFQNLLVQHTTRANISFLAGFNRELYIKILDKQLLEQAFNSAKSERISGNQFCCCYHSHQDDCIFKKNLSNELFRCDEEPLLPVKNKGNKNLDMNNENNNNHTTTNKKLSKDFPHLYHLRYKCECELRFKKNDF